jgi:hypothetical protein
MQIDGDKVLQHMFAFYVEDFDIMPVQDLKYSRYPWILIIFDVNADCLFTGKPRE